MDPTAVVLIVVAFVFGCITGSMFTKATAGKAQPASNKPKAVAAKTMSGSGRSFQTSGQKSHIAAGTGAAAKILAPEVLALLPDKKIEAIKAVRESTGMGLKEAKALGDAACSELNR